MPYLVRTDICRGTHPITSGIRVRRKLTHKHFGRAFVLLGQPQATFIIGAGKCDASNTKRILLVESLDLVFSQLGLVTQNDVLNSSFLVLRLDLSQNRVLVVVKPL